MTARDRYQIEARCTDCGHKGIASISENDGPYVRDLDRTIVTTAGMNNVTDNRGKATLRFICDCGGLMK
jgi:hypothetical protein